MNSDSAERPRSFHRWMSASAVPEWAIWFVFFGLIALSVVTKVYLSQRPGLWVDEIFSLSMATGHSLEHPASVAIASSGDYVQPTEALPPAHWRAFAEHRSPPAGAAEVVRAVFLSDTSPPLYYVLLSWWTRMSGTSDAALRLFSTLAAVASLPLLLQVGRMVGGRQAALVACLLFAWVPVGSYYSAEGRMYALTWFLGLALAWSSLAVYRGGSSAVRMAPWVLAAAAALLTHYFLAFVWCALIAWLLAVPGRSSRAATLVAAGLSLLLVAPWYLHIPESMANWRVTAGWLDTPLTTQQALLAPLKLAWSMAKPAGTWDPSSPGMWMVAIPVGIAALIALLRGPMRMTLFQGPGLLPWFWLGASILGVIVFDLAQGTQASLYPRYTLPGLPAAALVGGLLFARLPRGAAVLLLAPILTVWLGSNWAMVREPARAWQPFPEIAEQLDRGTTSRDVVIVRSIPSGVIGIARYMRGDTPIISWVESLRATDAVADLKRVVPATCRIAMIRIHDAMQGDDPAEPWLIENTILLAEDWGSDYYFRVLFFRGERGDCLDLD